MLLHNCCSCTGPFGIFLSFCYVQDEEQKLLHIKILDDDEHEPDTYFDVELYDPTTEDSNARSFVCSNATQ